MRKRSVGLALFAFSATLFVACSSSVRKNYKPMNQAAYRCLLNCHSRELACRAPCNYGFSLAGLMASATCDDLCGESYNYCCMACEDVVEDTSGGSVASQAPPVAR